MGISEWKKERGHISLCLIRQSESNAQLPTRLPPTDTHAHYAKKKKLTHQHPPLPTPTAQGMSAHGPPKKHPNGAAGTTPYPITNRAKARPPPLRPDTPPIDHRHKDWPTKQGRADVHANTRHWHLTHHTAAQDDRAPTGYHMTADIAYHWYLYYRYRQSCGHHCTTGDSLGTAGSTSSKMHVFSV